AAALGHRHDVVAGEVRAVEVVAAVHAQVAVAREQRGVGQRRGRVERAGTRVPARGDDRVQLQHAALAGEAVDAAVHLQAGFAQGPGDGAARVEAGGVLPVHPVEHAPVRIERQQPHRVQSFKGVARHCARPGPGRVGIADTGDFRLTLKHFSVGSGADQADLRSIGLHRRMSLYPVG
ncbi:hypothetical protein CATMIT_01643, partial [Catenibacterium mitsuokai DSM 15897]